jgi:MoaA/NifB/PqqE/SkfB family radical SAM enzyme
MKLLQKIDYKLGKLLQPLGLPYMPSVDSFHEWFRRNAQSGHCYYSDSGILISPNAIEERLARQYCDLARQYAPEQAYVVFDPEHLAQNGLWQRAHIKRCLPSAQYINLRHISVMSLEEVAHRPQMLEEYFISLPDAELHKLALLYTDYYSQAIFIPTDFCNLRCKMCYYHSEDESSQLVSFVQKRRKNITKHQLDDGTAYAFMDQIAPEQEIMFGGCGEFFTHKNWRNFFSYAFNRGLIPMVLTNGLLLNKENANFCLEHGLRDAIFSIDGYDKFSYENVRIGGRFETVMENLEYLFQKNKAYIRVNSIMLPEMQEKKEEIKKLFAEKAHAISFQTVKIDQYANTEKQLRKYEYSDLCYELLSGVILMPDGRYAPCCVVVNATFCVEFPWLLDSRKISFADARKAYAEMLFDEHSPLSGFCQKCNLKWQSYYYNGEHAFEEYVVLNPYKPDI